MEQSSSLDNSPFSPPKASLEQAESQVFDTTSPFSPKGRFGRVDYLAYSVLLGIAVMLFSGGLGAVMAVSGPSSESLQTMLIINALISLPAIVIGILFMIRRLHDLNWSGWIAVSYIIPLVNVVVFLILIFMRGTAGANDYGPPRQPPSRLKIMLALILPAIFIVGILAAIAIPAYQAYVAQAQGM